MSKRIIDLGEPGPLVVKPRVAWKMLSCSNTRGYELIAAGELQSYRDGRSRKITVESIQRYITRRLSPAAKWVAAAKPEIASYRAMVDILARLAGVQTARGGWTARWPAHEDRQSSLSVHHRDGKWLL